MPNQKGRRDYRSFNNFRPIIRHDPYTYTTCSNAELKIEAYRYLRTGLQGQFVFIRIRRPLVEPTRKSPRNRILRQIKTFVSEIL